MTPENEEPSGESQGTSDPQASQTESQAAPQSEHISLKEAQAGLQPYPPAGTQNPAAGREVANAEAGLQPYPPAGTANPAVQQSAGADPSEGQGSSQAKPPDAPSSPSPQESSSGGD